MPRLTLTVPWLAWFERLWFERGLSYVLCNTVYSLLGWLHWMLGLYYPMILTFKEVWPCDIWEALILILFVIVLCLCAALFVCLGVVPIQV